MFVKNLLNFLVLLMLNLHIARGGFLDIITTTPTKIMYGVLTGNYGKMLHTYVETVEKPVTYMVATTGVLEFRKHPHAAFFACGPDNNQFAKHLAEFAVVVTEGCLPKIDAMHACCLEHDACYTRLGVSQDECDKPFCNCMKVATNGSTGANKSQTVGGNYRDNGSCLTDIAIDESKIRRRIMINESNHFFCDFILNIGNFKCISWPKFHEIPLALLLASFASSGAPTATFMSKIAIYTHIYMLRWKLDQNKEQLQQKVLEKENKYISFYQQHSDNLSKILTLFAEMALYDDALCFLLREWMLSDLLNFIDQRHKLLKYFEMISKSNIRAVNKLRELFIMLVGGSRVALLCNIKELSFICAAPFTPYALMYSDYFQNKKSEIGKWRSKMVLEFSLYNKWGTNFFKKQYVKIRSEAADKCKYIADCVQVQTNFLTIMFKWWVSYSEIFWYNEKKIRAKIVDTLKKTRAKVNLLKEMITKADEHEPALQYAVETGDEKGEVRSFLP
uniref:Uncharacterized protein n=1 Tax=Globodera rostochiensis TaxID=31243 RepID=A0A914I3T3_GLORO